MTKKIVHVEYTESCRHCPFFEMDRTIGEPVIFIKECKFSSESRYVDDEYSIPDWCPLPDVKED